jgi:hypothetical protein
MIVERKHENEVVIAIAGKTLALSNESANELRNKLNQVVNKAPDSLEIQTDDMIGIFNDVRDLRNDLEVAMRSNLRLAVHIIGLELQIKQMQCKHEWKDLHEPIQSEYEPSISHLNRHCDKCNAYISAQIPTPEKPNR